MSPENDRLLCERYPKIFAQRLLGPQETAMCWGFECGDGWFNIIDRLCSCIQWHCDGRHIPGEVTCEQVVATQVKEKYGTLRFYSTGGDQWTDAYEGMAESMSAVTCEVCGGPGLVRPGFWLRCLCGGHAGPDGTEPAVPGPSAGP